MNSEISYNRTVIHEAEGLLTLRFGPEQVGAEARFDDDLLTVIGRRLTEKLPFSPRSVVQVSVHSDRQWGDGYRVVGLKFRMQSSYTWSVDRLFPLADPVAALFGNRPQPEGAGEKGADE